MSNDNNVTCMKVDETQVEVFSDMLIFVVLERNDEYWYVRNTDAEVGADY